MVASDPAQILTGHLPNTSLEHYLCVCLSVFLSIYLPIYLFIHPSIYGSISPLLGLGSFFNLLIFYTVGRTP
jgi:hypothetical protein